VAADPASSCGAGSHPAFEEATNTHRVVRGQVACSPAAWWRTCVTRGCRRGTACCALGEMVCISLSIEIPKHRSETCATACSALSPPIRTRSQCQGSGRNGDKATHLLPSVRPRGRAGRGATHSGRQRCTGRCIASPRARYAFCCASAIRVSRICLAMASETSSSSRAATSCCSTTSRKRWRAWTASAFLGARPRATATP
jgi:hypothetical protein